MYHAIEIIGYGRRRRYVIRLVIHPGLASGAVDGRAYRTLEAAKNAAAALGLEIYKTGDCYEIM